MVVSLEKIDEDDKASENKLLKDYSTWENDREVIHDKTILVVEDDAMLLEFIYDLLNTYGFKILSASDTQEALRYLEDNKQEIDLIFSDIRIPGGMDGISLVRKAKQLRSDLKVLLTTGFSQEMIEKPIQEEFQVLQKPYYPNTLAQSIHTLLDLPLTLQHNGKEGTL